MHSMCKLRQLRRHVADTLSAVHGMCGRTRAVEAQAAAQTVVNHMHPADNADSHSFRAGQMPPAAQRLQRLLGPHPCGWLSAAGVVVVAGVGAERGTAIQAERCTRGRSLFLLLLLQQQQQQGASLCAVRGCQNLTEKLCTGVAVRVTQVQVGYTQLVYRSCVPVPQFTVSLATHSLIDTMDAAPPLLGKEVQHAC